MNIFHVSRMHLKKKRLTSKQLQDDPPLAPKPTPAPTNPTPAPTPVPISCPDSNQTFYFRPREGDTCKDIIDDIQDEAQRNCGKLVADLKIIKNSDKSTCDINNVKPLTRDDTLTITGTGIPNITREEIYKVKTGEGCWYIADKLGLLPNLKKDWEKDIKKYDGSACDTNINPDDLLRINRTIINLPCLAKKNRDNPPENVLELCKDSEICTLVRDGTNECVSKNACIETSTNNHFLCGLRDKCAYSDKEKKCKAFIESKEEYICNNNNCEDFSSKCICKDKTNKRVKCFTLNGDKDMCSARNDCTYHEEINPLLRINCTPNCDYFKNESDCNDSLIDEQMWYYCKWSEGKCIINNEV